MKIAPIQNKILTPPFLAILLLLFFSACVQHRELITFDDPALGKDAPAEIINAINLTIQPEDLLRITVSSFDPLAAAPFNLDNQAGGNQQQQMMGGQGGQGLELFMGYLVDADGYIDFPVIGKISVVGKTLEQLNAELSEEVQKYLKDAVINIRYLNFKVTVLGEVRLPGTIRLTNKRVSILDAIGLAGDLTEYSNRKNVLVIREEDGVRSTQRLNLQTGDFFSSPYYYLKQNDVVYVEPLPVRTATVADPAQRFISYTSAGLSLITLIIALTR